LVPLALLDEPWLAGRRIIVLEPRRLATRAAARWMSRLLGEPVGTRVGYRVRRDSRVGPHTRIEVVTEGILTRMLNADPTLEGVGAVLFDEFHERSIHADLGLALALHTQRLVRPDLRLLVMSATLDAEPVARVLGGAPVITSAGRAHPVAIAYQPPRAGRPVVGAVPAAVTRALHETEGDILVFLPGQGEIRRAAAALEVPPEVDVHPLYGNLSAEDQDRAIAPSPARRRKVVLATSIAESSLTIEGVRSVIDSGLTRVARYSPRTGMTSLQTVRVSRASADQRAGRAGRVAPGQCLRLWPEKEQEHLVPFASPEIIEADLAPLVLELAVAGIHDVAELAWLDAPLASRVTQARELLAMLGALDADDQVTPHGRRMAELGTHPRVAHLLVRGAEQSLGETAADLAALLEARDVLRAAPGGDHDPDLRSRVELVNAARHGRPVAAHHSGGATVAVDTLRAVVEEARAWRRALGASATRSADVAAVGALIALAYPDRLAAAREGSSGRFVMRSGSGASLVESTALRAAEFLAIAETDGKTPDSRIYLCASLSAADVREQFADQIVAERRVAWNATTQTVQATRRERLGAIVLSESTDRAPDADVVAAVLLDAVRESRLALLTWTDEARETRQRLSFLHRQDGRWPDVSTDALLSATDRWLAGHLRGFRGAADLRKIDLSAALRDLLDWSQRRQLDELAPVHFVAPTGSRLRIDYSDPTTPVVRVRLQEMFGCIDTPTVANGRVTLSVHLLSPAHRPVQVTRDLGSFWRSSYADVRRELRGRYPRHAWPENPLQAPPTRRPKPRGT
jgi:ATP-dependent helicase HrpB